MLTRVSDSLDSLGFKSGYAKLGDRFSEHRNPTGLGAPYLVALSPSALELVRLRGTPLEPSLVEILAGNRLPTDSQPTAAVYAGHQFGYFVPQLGDGRAITLGETIDALGEPIEWQLKGAGETAFSRMGDGRAVLRSTIREFLCSEAMHALGIPTTRALAIVGSDDPVRRETVETTAVLTRLAPSHVRFGTFEYFYYRKQFDEVRILADYVIDRFRSSLRAGEHPYAAFLDDVVQRTARLMAQWQAIGFAHGVMNTDNMSILGLTLDYGPFGFLDAYDPGFICNHTDQGGRYAFDRQPTIGLWNCHALAETLSTLVDKETIESVLARYEPTIRGAYLSAMNAKLGLASIEPEDAALLGDLLRTMQVGRVDYTIAWRALSTITAQSDGTFAKKFPDRERIAAWIDKYRARLQREGSDDLRRATRMDAVNPKIILRNHLAQSAIEAAQRKDFKEIARLHAALGRPFDENPEFEAYAQPPPDWAKHLEISCSS